MLQITHAPQHGRRSRVPLFRGGVLARAPLAVSSLSLGETKIHQDAPAVAVVVQKIGRLDVSVDDAMGVHVGQRSKQRAEVQSHVRDRESAEVFTEVDVLEIGKDGNDLVGVPEGGDKWND